MLPDWFTVAEVCAWVCALAHSRSRPAVALRVRLRASPSAQDDTEGHCLLTYNAETNESLLQWEKVAAAG